jgi:uncharacterized repeat protein (TIGR01451 family)
MHSRPFDAPTHDTGGTVNNRPAFGASMGSVNVHDSSFSERCWQSCKLAKKLQHVHLHVLMTIMVFLVLSPPAFSQATTPAGTTIRNVASISFNDASGVATTVTSNAVDATVAPVPSVSSVEILRAAGTAGTSMQSTAGPTQCVSPQGVLPLSAPLLADGTTVDPMQPLTLSPTSTLHGGEAMFVHLVDADQNRNAGIVDTTELRLTTSGDRETLRLSETGDNTGIFVGYIQTQARNANPGNCLLEVQRNTEVSSVYIDPFDAEDASRASALVDPYGLIFDSRTGEPIDGARVRLVSANTGALAKVVGDDGVSNYPAEMITGAAVTDSGGTIYTLPAGVFRFPLVEPGSYRIEVDPPAGRAFPSALSVSQLDQTPGAPFRLGGGSFGEAFAADGPAAVAVDVPVDAAPTQLFMQKSTTASVAAVGDFIQYTLTIENIATNTAVANVRTEDTLPLGARYVQGSTRMAGAATTDPAISPDGRTLTFTSGALGPGQRAEIRYVVEVTAGARTKELVNAARAFGPDEVASNTAQVTVQLREELFRDRAIVLGRVVEGDCTRPAHELKGVAGVRVYMEDGRYSISDEDGKYHFDDVRPGSHVVQIDTVTIPETHLPLTCSERVRHAGRAYSQFVDVRGGALWRSDFVLERKAAPTGTAKVELTTSIARTGGLTHAAVFSAAKLGVEKARLMIMLPEGLVYRAGSARRGGAPIADPRIDSGTLTFALAGVPSDTSAAVSFETDAAENASGALPIKALAIFDSAAQNGVRTEVIENRILRGEMFYESASYRFTSRFDVLDTQIKATDRAQLDKIIEEWRGVSHLRLTAVGHSDDQLIAARSRIAYADNYSLSKARAAAVAEYLGQGLGIDPGRVTIEGRGADEPLSKGRDGESLAMNRRVEIAIEGLRIVGAGGFTLKSPSAISSEIQTVGTLSSSPSNSLNSVAPIKPPAASAELNMEVLEPEVRWIAPADDEIPAIPSIKVLIQHLPTQRVELLMNGAAVSPLNFDGVGSNQGNTVSVSRWRGVDLRAGENELVAVVRDENEREIQRMTRKVHYSGGAVRAEIVRAASRLTADGRTRPVIALRMFDAYGEPARPGTQGAFRVEAPYRSWWEVDSLNDNKLVAIGTREPTFRVEEDGLARLELEPTTQAGTATIRLRFNERQQQEIRIWLEPAARDWILVGIAEGTATHQRISNNMQSAADAGLEEGYSDDGRVAFFAKGAIKGEYLLTAAYDSARDHELDKDRLLGAVEPDRFYTLYGDATEQRFEAATTRKLFLKLERQQFAALFGDFETGMTVTELSRYSRTFTGFKTDFAGERFGYTAFAAESEQGYVKDELQGDGTSGLYRLSRRPLIVNSDKIRIEVRDRFRSEVIVESRPLTRHLDYSIDYLNGTLFFKQPVPSRDASFNHVFIIAEYEVLNGGEEEVTAGGRAAVKFANDKVEFGGSFLHEGATAGDTQIAGTDMRWQIGAATELRAELAQSSSDDPTGEDRATAYLTELEHVGEKLDARVYIREQESGFGVGQQVSLDTGTRKAGFDGRYRWTQQVAVETETYRQEVLDSGAQRELVSAEVRYDADDYTAGLGARHVADAGLATGDAKSQQAFVSGSIDLFDDLITLRASQDLALAGKKGSVDFPDRSILGVDYHWRTDTSFFAEYEHADGERFDADMTRLGVRTSPWERAQIESSMNQQATEFGPRVFANVGLTQGWQLNERWGFDVGVDQSRTVRGSDVQAFDPDVPLASGTLGGGDFLASFIGAVYQSELWTFTSRLEHRDSDDEDRWVAAGGFYREPIAGHAFSLATQWFDSASTNGIDAMAGDIQLAWAYRPASSAWIVLNRLDLKHESRTDTAGDIESARAIDNMNTNWQLDERTQLGVQFGARYVRSTFDGERYSGVSTLYGLDVRRDLTHRFDIGLHGTMLSSLRSNVSDQSIGFDVGVTVARNVWISIGYNFQGFRDDDFEASRYIAQGPFLKFRMKADQETFKDLSLAALRPAK